MEIFQGTISSDYKCRPYLEDEKPTGLLFYKKNSLEDDFFTYILITIGIGLCFFVWYILSFKYFLIAFAIFIAVFVANSIRERNVNELEGIKYSIKDISEVKVLENDTMSSFSKSGATSLAGAAVGGVLFGGAGAVVGSIASGNNNFKEQIVRVGVRFEDTNWVVLQMQIDDTLMGKVNKSNLDILLSMTSSKQLAPF